MKIATWNLERVRKTFSRYSTIINCLKDVNADILILTETNATIDLGDEYNMFHSDALSNYYHPDERRVGIFSKYNVTRSYETYKSDTAICHEFDTPFGPLAVYATVMGVFGNRDPKSDYSNEVDKQIADIMRIAAQTSICVAGDFNMSFSDNYYSIAMVRNKLNTAFINSRLYNVTAVIPETIDHIVLSKQLINGKKVTTETWNDPVDKKLSDHKGVAVTLF